MRQSINQHKENNQQSKDVTIDKEIAAIETIIAQYFHASPSTTPTSSHTAAQVLTVRSSVDGGLPKQLFTGLRLPSVHHEPIPDSDIKKLPNGFDVVEAVSCPDTPNNHTQETRTFGQVFRQTRNTRPLDLPKPAKSSQAIHLRFSQPLESLSSSKDDYRSAALTSGSWLQYTAPPSDKNANLSDKDVESLFNSSFTSFAPAEDNTMAIVPRSTRAQLWYRKHGTVAMRKILPIVPLDEDKTVSIYPDIDDDFQQVIQDYLPTNSSEIQHLQSSEDKDADELLEEVSSLLQSLASYQSIRDLDPVSTSRSRVEPEKDEFDIFEMLRLQLMTLIAALPPFALAKLDGQQLGALNLSTKILLRTPDIAGTGQPDDGTLHRQRVTQAQQAALNRPPNPTPIRNSYANIPPSNYNPQMRSYVHPSTQTPSMPGYAQRNSQMYNTPRANVTPNANYNQTSNYSRNQQPYPGATIQQYQRMQNGYTPNSQAQFQQKVVQNPQTHVRSASPAKPLLNGQVSSQSQNLYPQRNQQAVASNSTSLLHGPYAQANAHATIQQLKAHQQSQSPQPQIMTNQRQASGTPQPQPQSQAQVSNLGLPQTPVNGVSSQAAMDAANGLQQKTALTPQPVSVGGVDAGRG